jgi:hypothetical protein
MTADLEAKSDLVEPVAMNRVSCKTAIFSGVFSWLLSSIYIAHYTLHTAHCTSVRPSSIDSGVL